MQLFLMFLPRCFKMLTPLESLVIRALSFVSSERQNGQGVIKKN